MIIFIILQGRKFPLDVQEDIGVKELKEMISKRIGGYPNLLIFQSLVLLLFAEIFQPCFCTYSRNNTSYSLGNIC